MAKRCAIVEIDFNTGQANIHVLEGETCYREALDKVEAARRRSLLALDTNMGYGVIAPESAKVSNEGLPIIALGN